MSTKTSGVLLCLAGLLAIAGGIAAIGLGAFKMVDSFQAVATMEAPGSLTIEVEQPQHLTLWHDHRAVFQGRTVYHSKDLPDGFTFELMHTESGKSVPLTGLGSRSNLSTGSTERVGLGSFDLQQAGTYELRVEGPESRILSVTEGSPLSGIAGLFGGFGLGMFSGLIGMVLIVLGAVTLFSGKRDEAPH